MPSTYFDALEQKISPNVRKFTTHSFDIVDRVNFLLKEKNMTLSTLAMKIGEPFEVIDQWLSTGHNLTLMAISQLEIALEASIIVVEKEEKQEENQSINKKVLI